MAKNFVLTLANNFIYNFTNARKTFVNTNKYELKEKLVFNQPEQV